MYLKLFWNINFVSNGIPFQQIFQTLSYDFGKVVSILISMIHWQDSALGPCSGSSISENERLWALHYWKILENSSKIFTKFKLSGSWARPIIDYGKLSGHELGRFLENSSMRIKSKFVDWFISIYWILFFGWVFQKSVWLMFRKFSNKG